MFKRYAIHGSYSTMLAILLYRVIFMMYVTADPIHVLFHHINYHLKFLMSYDPTLCKLIISDIYLG